jgi:hypothetical protein
VDSPTFQKKGQEPPHLKWTFTLFYSSLVLQYRSFWFKVGFRPMECINAFEEPKKYARGFYASIDDEWMDVFSFRRHFVGDSVKM